MLYQKIGFCKTYTGCPGQKFQLPNKPKAVTLNLGVYIA
jgi:hypothetical protein